MKSPSEIFTLLKDFNKIPSSVLHAQACEEIVLIKIDHTLKDQSFQDFAVGTFFLDSGKMLNCVMKIIYLEGKM